MVEHAVASKRVADLLIRIIESPGSQKHLTFDGSIPEKMPLARAMQALRQDAAADYGRRLAEIHNCGQVETVEHFLGELKQNRRS